jgi:uncharacterized membrane protein
MSNIFAAYVTLVIALATSTIAVLVTPKSRLRFKPWHWIVTSLSAILVIACAVLFGLVLLENPIARQQPEWVTPFVLAIAILALLIWKLARRDGAIDSSKTR